MKNLITIFFCLMLGCTYLAAQDITKKMDELIAAYASNGNFNGTVLVAQKGVILLQKGYGLKNAGTKEKNDGNTIFQIGSITKQFTSAIVLQLQEEKKLSLQDKLSKFFPEFPQADKITIEQLLSHTSGVYNYTNDENFMKTEAVKPTSREKLFALFKDKPLEFEPGSQFNYSNSGYILLGYIIEKVTGKSYEKVVREKIFTPLNMTHSGFDFATLKSADKASGYYALTSSENKPAPIVDSSVSFSAGAIYTTVGDLYKWDRSLYSEKIISKASLKNAYSIRKGQYGLGWVIDSAYGQEIYQHGGGIFGFSSFINRSPAEDICVILNDNKGDGALGKIAGQLNAILHNKPYELPKEKTAITVDSSILRQYVGEYELSPNFILIITFENGKMMVQATGQPKLELLAEKENLFFLTVADVEIEFLKDATGKTDKLILYQNGSNMPAKKTK